MKSSHKIKTISCLKENAAKLAEEFKANDEAAMAIHSIQEFKQKQKTLALLKRLAQREKSEIA